MGSKQSEEIWRWDQAGGPGQITRPGVYEFLKGNYGYTDGQEKGDMGKKYRNH